MLPSVMREDCIMSCTSAARMASQVCGPTVFLMVSATSVLPSRMVALSSALGSACRPLSSALTSDLICWLFSGPMFSR